MRSYVSFHQYQHETTKMLRKCIDDGVPDFSKKSKHAETVHHGYNPNFNLESRRLCGRHLNMGRLSGISDLSKSHHFS